MKKSFTLFCTVLFSLVATLGASAQADGDYRTAGSGFWDAAATWQIFHTVGGWTAASVAPSNTDGKIEIQNGHTVTLQTDVTADQVVIDGGGILAINNGGVTINTFTLNDGPGVDLTVNGTLNLGGFDILTGTGSAAVEVFSGGVMNWTSGDLDVATTVDASSNLNLFNDFDKSLNNVSLTINGTMNWATGTNHGGILMTDAIFNNNGTINEQFQSDRFLWNQAGTNSVANNGLINKTTTQLFTINTPFTNNGTLQGQGAFAFTGTVANTGTIGGGTPNGSAVAILGTTLNSVSGLSTTISTPIVSTGAVAGTNYDQVQVTDASGTVNLGSASLTITEPNGVTGDAVGTSYIVFSVPNGTTTIGTQFQAANIHVPADIDPALIYTATTVTAKKITPLPLTWGPFNATLNGDNVVLNWSTYSETNTSRFVIGYSTDGKTYNSIGTVNAAGNSTKASSYTFTHTNPNLNGANYYRLQEVDLDGKNSYSSVRVVNMSNKQVLKVLAAPNPVHDLLQLTTQENGIIAYLYTADGKALRTWQLQPGTQQVSIGELPAGNYQLVVFQKGQRVEAQHITKF